MYGDNNSVPLLRSLSALYNLSLHTRLMPHDNCIQNCGTIHLWVGNQTRMLSVSADMYLSMEDDSEFYPHYAHYTSPYITTDTHSWDQHQIPSLFSFSLDKSSDITNSIAYDCFQFRCEKSFRQVATRTIVNYVYKTSFGMAFNSLVCWPHPSIFSLHHSIDHIRTEMLTSAFKYDTYLDGPNEPNESAIKSDRIASHSFMVAINYSWPKVSK